MKVVIEAKDRQEAQLLKRALEEPITRAYAIVMGVLLTLPSDRARRRVLRYLRDKLNENAELSPQNGKG